MVQDVFALVGEDALMAWVTWALVVPAFLIFVVVMETLTLVVRTTLMFQELLMVEEALVEPEAWMVQETQVLVVHLFHTSCSIQ